ncbi:MAG: magnesium transporter [Flavobacteriales bacterium]|nr:magnesium transporter [Flavobacteriales bacterium]|tara:strand:+ start:4820 stop:6163 length:1344 start_codon:yes stop_codon:yes gene_type:complete
MNFKLTKILLEKFDLLILQKNNDKLLSLCNNLLAPDVAEILKSLDFEKTQYLFNILDDELRADILIELEEDLREKLLFQLSSKEIVKDVIDNLESDDAVDVIQRLPAQKQKEVLLNIINPKQASDIADLLTYDNQSAGALMAKELIKVYEEWSVLRCVSEMRKQAQYVNQVYTIYVVDKSDNLIGTVSLKKLLLTPEKTFIRDIYNKQIISVNTLTSAEEVALIMNKYNLIVLPVINNTNKLIGRITIDDVVDFIKEEAEKDYQLASGISDNVEDQDSIFTLTKARIPWLIIGMLGGLLGAQIIGLFNIEQNPLLAFFIPLIAAMGGNVGVQSSAIIVQALAAKNLGIDSWAKRFIKELSISLLNGLICSILLFLISSVIYSQPHIPLTISISLLTVMIFAALFGTFVPLILNKYKIDPALATGPFITTMNDVIGLFIYFSIAKLIL